jgi:serine/threonine protein kinase
MVDDGSPHDSAAPAPRSFANGRFVVRGHLGRGTFADVYLADDVQRGSAVAVKVLAPEWSRSSSSERFVQGARLLRSVDDPRVVAVHEVGETEDGRPFLVMDHASGGTLAGRLAELRGSGTPISDGDVHETARALSDAIGFLHSRQIAHGDLKPTNVLIAPGDSAGARGVLRAGERFVLGDLGIAAAVGGGTDVTDGAGDRRYAAPERSDPTAAVDVRADVYSASALLAELASGDASAVPRRCDRGAVTSGPPWPTTIAPPLAGALARGLDTDPNRRPSTIQQWFADVGDALSPGHAAPPPPSATMVSRTEPAGGSVVAAPSRRRWRAAVAGLVVAVVVAVAVIVIVAVTH